MSRIHLAGILLLITASPVRAAPVEIPLSIDARVVRQAVAAALELDPSGETTLAADDCNQASVADLSLTPDGTHLQLTMTVDARAGASLFGGCLGAVAWRGRMHAWIHPAAAPDGLAIVLEPESAELRQADDAPGLLTRPARLLAERLILPRLDGARVDLREPLASLDAMLAGLQPEGATRESTSGTHLARLAVTDKGILARLAIELAPVPASAAIPEPALDERELAEWRRLEDELDGFLTAVIADLASRAADDDLRVELLGVLLDSRLAIARALAEPGTGSEDPVRPLFIDAWDRMRPLARELARSDPPGGGALQLAGFIAGADAIRALDALGPEYGIEISRDGLRRLARILLADEAPVSFTPLPLGVNDRLKLLFGLARIDNAPAASPGMAAKAWDWLLPAAMAANPSPAEALRGMVPRVTEIEDYLQVVAALLEAETRAHLRGDSRIPAAYRSLLDPLVRATAWKETCWRHYLDNADPPSVIRSPVGAVGMMQINVRVWRGLYDMERLESDVAYNVAAGIAIIEHYLVDYALRRGEHGHSGGTENLVRATYAAYNGGPGQMSRYRKASTPARLRSIDEAFWRHYERIRNESWPDVGSCYPV